MTKLLTRLFIKNYENTSEPAVRKSYGTLSSVVGIIVNFILAAFKILAGIMSGSVAIIADAFNNLSDSGTSVITLISFKLSSKPADKEHPYGHARIEYVASMIVSFLVLLIGADLLKESIGKIIEPSKTEFSIVSIVVLGVSVIIKLALALFNSSLGKKIDSDVMKATAADSLSDALATTAVLISMLIMRFAGFDTDAYMGIIVAVIILVAGIKILAETKDHILGTAPDAEIIEAVHGIIRRYPESLGIHDMRIHNYGPGRTVASFHVEVDGGGDIFALHDAIDNMEKQIAEELSIECTIHLDPIVTDDEKVASLREAAKKKVLEIDGQLNIHDFRFVEGHTHTNLIFDVVAPFEIKMTDEELSCAVNTKIKEISPDYFTVITIDRE